MAKNKRPNNGNRPNNGKRPNNANRPNSGKRPNNMARPNAGNRPNNNKRPSSSARPASRNEESVRKEAENKKNVTPIRSVKKERELDLQNKIVSGVTHENRPQNPDNDPVPAQFRRPLFGDETDAKKTVVAEKDSPSARARKLSWWKVHQVERKNRNLQKAKLKEKRKEEMAAIAAAEAEAAKKAKEVPDVLEETQPEVGEARRQHMAKKRRRDSLRAAFNSLLSILILVGMLIIAVLYVVDYVAAKPTYAFATEGTIEHTLGATALVVREETVMTSTHTGSLLSQATEGSRVAKGQLLAMVIPEGMESTLTELHNVEQQIVDRERQLMLQGKGVAAKTIFNETNEEIKPIITTIRQDTMQMKLSNMTSYSSSIRVLMEKRDTDLQSVDFGDEQLTALRGSESALQNQLENRANSVYADSPGIVSYKLDGHETDITLDLLMDMVDTKCDSLIKESNSIITGDLNVKQNEPILRIVQNDVQYFACELENAPMEEFKLGSTHVIRIPSEGISISDCEVVRSSVTRKGLLIVFKTANQVERLLDRRTVNIEIVQTKTSGIRVPVSALVDADYDRGIATIYVNESGYARGYTVQVKDYDREFAIIAPISEEQSVPSISTIVITNPQTVKEGDKVEK
ncbi:MAG: hypothetical protein J5750_07330 [Clostridiales bacterium]|nr:hypothetical protein [Clostridiales bacterium]